MNAATVDEIITLREHGLSAGQIAYRLGVNESTVRNWWTPRRCSCGARISWGTSRCPACAVQPKIWTREAIVEAMQSWARVHGRPPTARDWIRADPDRRWPAATSIYGHYRGAPFSSWAEALEVAGFDRPKQGQRFGERWWTRELVISEIRKLAVNGIVLSSDDESLAQTARKLFGDWHTACVAAGVQLLHVGEQRRDVESRLLPGEDAQAHRELGS